ncbi:hypothetical protein B0O99DRAFT_333325 [Bisporella sp. PMI_857]|nr:hypothetical protein B0O99DRAFT_333325 [Bisporella sp. PMI_857]
MAARVHASSSPNFRSWRKCLRCRPEQKASSYLLHMQAYVPGYAYTKSSKAAWASLMVLFAYVGVATVFITISIVVGVTSSSRGSAAELLALAIMSPASERMKNTAAGASTIKSYKGRYFIVAEGGGIQLRHWEGKLPLDKRVQPNFVYG